jgi:2-C-methyl-D-erythritol 2,4-cyclodiphosphate synthase
MKEIIAHHLYIDKMLINIKGKTTEGMGFEGKREGISAYTIATIKLPNYP